MHPRAKFEILKSIFHYQLDSEDRVSKNPEYTTHEKRERIKLNNDASYNIVQELLEYML